jgi:hypothetical protein
MMTPSTTTVEIRTSDYWPDEAALTTFAEKDDRAEKADRLEQTNQPVKDEAAYAALYFVS